MYTDTVKEILVEKNPVKAEFAQITAVLFITYFAHKFTQYVQALTYTTHFA